MAFFLKRSQATLSVLLLATVTIASCSSNQSAPPAATSPAPVAASPASPAPGATAPAPAANSTAPATQAPAPAPATQAQAPAPQRQKYSLPIACIVQDPTGTALNVRDGVDGKVIDTLPNGSSVFLNSYATEDLSWGVIASQGDMRLIRGTVFVDYLKCS